MDSKKDFSQSQKKPKELENPIYLRKVSRNGIISGDNKK
jgi:hypothetical protein